MDTSKTDQQAIRETLEQLAPAVGGTTTTDQDGLTKLRIPVVPPANPR